MPSAALWHPSHSKHLREELAVSKLTQVVHNFKHLPFPRFPCVHTKLHAWTLKNLVKTQEGHLPQCPKEMAVGAVNEW